MCGLNLCVSMYVSVSTNPRIFPPYMRQKHEEPKQNKKRLRNAYDHDCLQNAALWTNAGQRDKHAAMRNKQRLVLCGIKGRRWETRREAKEKQQGRKDGTAAISGINEKAGRDGIKEA